MYRKVSQSRPGPTQQKNKHGGFFGTFGQKYSHIERYQKRLEDIEENVRLKQSEASLAGEVPGK